MQRDLVESAEFWKIPWWKSHFVEQAKDGRRGGARGSGRQFTAREASGDHRAPPDRDAIDAGPQATGGSGERASQQGFGVSREFDLQREPADNFVLKRRGEILDRSIP